MTWWSTSKKSYNNILNIHTLPSLPRACYFKRAHPLIAMPKFPKVVIFDFRGVGRWEPTVNCSDLFVEFAWFRLVLADHDAARDTVRETLKLGPVGPVAP